MPQVLQSLLLKAHRDYADQTALSIGKNSYSYQQLLSPVMPVARLLQKEATTAVAVLADKTFSGYQAICAALLSGHTYVPMNTAFPIERNAEIVRQSGADTVLVATGCEADAEAIAAVIDAPLQLVSISEHVQPNGQSELPKVISNDNHCAYLLLTSGSTGIPKAVPVSDNNIASYLSHIRATFEFHRADRFSQFFDFTFDLSLHDMLVCWDHGACLCPADRSARLMPLHFARKQKITVWFSVPSLALTAKDMLRQKFVQFALPDIRLSLFCGEALPAALASDWLHITHAPVVNLYGPTEATIACTVQHYKPDMPCHQGIVPIGKPFGANQCAILDDKGQPVEKGELCLAGDQVFKGYWHREDLIDSTFYTDQNKTRWYRTGDLCTYSDERRIVYLGRLDRQVQVKGYRVELQEVEHYLRTITGTETIAVVPYPVNAVGEPTGLTAYVKAGTVLESELIQKCQQRMPAYMVPQQFVFMASFPYNSSGKLDHKVLLQNVEVYLNKLSQHTA